MLRTAEKNRHDSVVALATALLSSTGDIRARTRNRVARDIPATRQAPVQAVSALFDMQYERIMQAVRDTLPASARPALGPRVRVDPAHARRALAALRGRPDIVVAVCSTTLAETIETATRLADQLGTPPAALLCVLNAATLVSDTASRSLATMRSGHVAPTSAVGDTELRVRLARALLFAGSAPTDLRTDLTVYDIDADRDYLAFVARPGPGQDCETLAAELDEIEPYSYRNGLVATINGSVVGFLATAPGRVRNGIVGVGPPRPLDRLVESFQLARRALDTMHAFGVAGVHSFDTLGLLPLVLSDSDVGDCLYVRYVGPVTGPGAPVGLLAAVRAWYDSGMHVERAARQVDLHPNTLRHRITRFQELTGANLREPVIAMEVWWALRRAELAERATVEHRVPPPAALAGFVAPRETEMS